jgi:hypothetical protein
VHGVSDSGETEQTPSCQRGHAGRRQPPIKLRVIFPHVIDILLVNLPGIQHAGPTKEAITALIEENIKKPETLKLIVSEAKQNAELTKAIELAAKYNPNHEQTICVLSSFDNFDMPDSKKRAIDLVTNAWKLRTTRCHFH